MYDEQFELNTELESLNVFSELRKLLKQKLKTYKKYIQKYNDSELEEIFNDIQNIIEGYV